jgi:hypothetical protein
MLVCADLIRIADHQAKTERITVKIKGKILVSEARKMSTVISLDLGHGAIHVIIFGMDFLLRV